MMNVTSTIALQTDLPDIASRSLFSPTFFSPRGRSESSRRRGAELEAVYRKFTHPAEQVETELTIACVLCQRTGL